MYQSTDHCSPRVVPVVRVRTNERAEQTLALGQLLAESRSQPPVQYLGRDVAAGPVMRNIEAIDAGQLKSNQRSVVGCLTESISPDVTGE